MERKKEDCKAKLLDALQRVGLGHVKIENAHRVGEFTPGRNRAIIARFNDRPELRLVLSKRKEFFNMGLPVFADLCKEDLEEKKKYAGEMRRLFNEENKRVYFDRGCWYVEGRRYTPGPGPASAPPAAAARPDLGATSAAAAAAARPDLAATPEAAPQPTTPNLTPAQIDGSG